MKLDSSALPPIDADDRRDLDAVVSALEAAWNRGDGAAFGAPFAEDADFVTVRGEHLRGRSAIAGGHDGIFRTIYAGSTNQYSVLAARALSEGVALVHVRADLNVPHGPLAGEHAAVFSMVLRKESGAWEIAAFHNTMVAG